MALPTEQAVDNSSAQTVVPPTEVATLPTDADTTRADEPTQPDGPPPQPQTPLQIPVPRFGIQEFTSQFTVIHNELRKIAENKFPSFDRLMLHLNNVSTSVHQQLINLNRLVSNEILNNRNLTPTQRVQFINQLFTAYQAATDAIDKEFQDQISAAKELFTTLNINEAVDKIVETIDQVSDSQTDSANKLIGIPATLATNVNGHYVKIESAVIDIRQKLGNLQ